MSQNPMLDEERADLERRTDQLKECLAAHSYSAEPATPHTDWWAVISLASPILGVLVFGIGLAESTHGSDWFGAPVRGFAIWAAFGFVGLIATIISMRRHGSTGLSSGGMLLSALPFFIVVGLFLVAK